LERIEAIQRQRAAREPLKGFDRHSILAGRFSTDGPRESVFGKIAGERLDRWHWRLQKREASMPAKDFI
jgi:hypothetical protein